MKAKLSIAMLLAVILAMLLTSLALADNVPNDVTPAADDTTPPVITFLYSGGGTENGWYTSDGLVTWYVVEDESPISSTSGCDPIYMGQETAGTTLTCSATSEGGTSTHSEFFRLDLGAPTIYASYSPDANQWGWNNTDVTLTFVCEDNMAGVMYCEPERVFTDEGAGQGGGSARVVDYAWHDDRLFSWRPINIDKTPPNVSLIGGPADGGTYDFGSVPYEPTCSASDALSGLDGSCWVSGYSTTIGSHTVTASATDKAGNSASASATYTVAGTDSTPPVILCYYSGGGCYEDWNTMIGVVSWYVYDQESDISSSSGCEPTTFSANTAGTTLTCTATSAGGTRTVSNTFRIDAGEPTINGSYSPAANAWGWNNTDVTVTFTCSDDMSGMNYCEGEQILSYEGANQYVRGRAVDWAWNYNWIYVGPINIDKTPPTVSLVGGPANGGTYYFGFVPSTPTCSASDALSGLDGSCSVSGYSTAVGSHTVTASATDKAGNSTSASATYTVQPWTLSGFYAPVDMNGVYNVVRSGNRVALKFEVFAGRKELSDTSVVQSFNAALVACPPGSGEAIEGGASALGDTALRYDTTAGRFILNWQTPRQAGACYRVTMMTQDGSSLVAFFRLR